jgi:hypothetical protein
LEYRDGRDNMDAPYETETSDATAAACPALKRALCTPSPRRFARQLATVRFCEHVHCHTVSCRRCHASCLCCRWWRPFIYGDIAHTQAGCFSFCRGAERWTLVFIRSVRSIATRRCLQRIWRFALDYRSG